MGQDFSRRRPDISPPMKEEDVGNDAGLKLLHNSNAGVQIDPRIGHGLRLHSHLNDQDFSLDLAMAA